ncbi:MAG: phosphoribosyltransferase [Planctomycetota bacterium]
MNYRSIADMTRDLSGFVGKLPTDIDVVVGVPRSGMLAASILALLLNRRLTDLEGLFEDRLISSGRRAVSRSDQTIKKILIVEDSVSVGESIKRVRQRIDEAKLPYDVEYLAVYVTPGHHDLVDYSVAEVGPPRVFEWNVMHHEYLGRACVDIDGVLCVDPTREQNDDGERYLDFLRTAAPLRLPSLEIGWLVTSRLEKYREPTEQWLRDHGVAYRELRMMPAATPAERFRIGHANFKAKTYMETDSLLFLESEPAQASEIARLSGKAVLCIETMRLADRDAPQPASYRARSLHHKVKRRLKKWLR